MMKFLFPNVEWNDIQIVGFDLDGTLYDEFDFLYQSYAEVASYLAQYTITKSVEVIHQYICEQRIQKGEAYPFIFDDAISCFLNLSDQKHKVVLGNCLSIYRNIQPRIWLPKKVELLLTVMHQLFPLFLVSNGNQKLQQSKYQALELDRFFSENDVLFLGKKSEQKPNVDKLGSLALLNDTDPSRILFFGNSKIDQQFAKNAGYQFQRVYCMLQVTS